MRRIIILKELYWKKLYKSKKGQGIVEYGMILFFIALSLVTLVSTLGSRLADLFVQIRNAFPG